MSNNNAITPNDADRDWARKLRRKVGRQVLRSAAEAVIADALAAAIGEKQLWRMEFLLTTPLPSIFSRHPALPNPETAFTDAWSNSGENARQKARYYLPHLQDKNRSTPLMAAVLADFQNGAERLLEKGAQSFHRSAVSPTGYGGPLGAAIFLGRKNLMTLLTAQPAVQQELKEKPAFRNYLLLTALGTDCAATLDHLATCDPELLDKGRVYGDHRADEFKLGEGIFAAQEKLKIQRAFEESQRPKASKYNDAPKSRRQPAL